MKQRPLILFALSLLNLNDDGIMGYIEIPRAAPHNSAREDYEENFCQKKAQKRRNT